MDGQRGRWGEGERETEREREDGNTFFLSTGFTESSPLIQNYFRVGVNEEKRHNPGMRERQEYGWKRRTWQRIMQ